MDALYGWLLFLYPALYRREFGGEMQAVFREANTDASRRGWTVQLSFYVRETLGLLAGALQERLRFTTGGSVFFSRRFHMRSEFRFPRSTTVLMTLILAGVILAMQKARDIAESLPAGNPRIPAIHPAPPTFTGAIGIMFATVYVAAVIAWAILFALHRSGVHRLGDLDTESRKG